MFGTSFSKSDDQPAAALVTIMEARAIVAPLCDALNQSSKNDLADMLRNVKFLSTVLLLLARWRQRF
jgi:hypothetical protein